jgi:mannose-6-phosphate isomerase-like protein (cupin superfamily)
MYVKHTNQCLEITVGGHTQLRELLHHEHDMGVQIGFGLSWAKVAPGEESTLRKVLSGEVYYILSGKGRVYGAGLEYSVSEGSIIYFSPGESQNLANTGDTDLTFIVILDSAYSTDDAIVEPMD